MRNDPFAKRRGASVAWILAFIFIILSAGIYYHFNQRIQKQNEALAKKELDLKNEITNKMTWNKRYIQEQKKYKDAHMKGLMLQLIDETLQVRGLPTTRVASINIADKGFLKKYIEEEMAQQGEKLDIEERALKVFGLLEPDFNIREAMIALYEEQTGGFYDPKSKQFYIMEGFDLDNSISQMIVSHELTHFLQDMNSQYVQIVQKDEVNNDTSLTYLSILEGDATYSMMKWYEKFGIKRGKIMDVFDTFMMVGMSQDQINSAPKVITEPLLAAYIQGLEFYQHLESKGIEDWHNAPFKKVPKSMEMILHPQKYIEYKDFPKSVTIPESEEKKHGKPIYEDVFGELYIRVLCDQFRPGEKSLNIQAAAGWGGDKFAMYKDGYVVWLLEFDSKPDEHEFAEFMDNAEALWQETVKKNHYQLEWKKEGSQFRLEFSPEKESVS